MKLFMRPMLLMLVLLATLLGACASDSRPPDRTGSDGVVTIGFGAPEYDRALYAPLIDAFNAQNPTMRVQFVALEANGESNALTQQAVRAADTAVVDSISRADMTNGTLHDLAPMIDADLTFKRDDWYPGTLEMFSLDNRTYLLPRSVPVPMLSYNKSLWLKRGLPLPKPDWTWQDLTTAATQLAQKTGGKVNVYGLFDGGDSRYAFLAELAAVGITPFSAPSGQFKLDRPEIVQALERVQALIESGAVATSHPSTRGAVNSDDPYQLISDQQIAIWWPIYFGPRSSEAPAAPFEVGAVPMPAIPLPYYEASGASEGYIMSGGTQHPQESWRWLSFLSRQALNIQYAVPTAAPTPARRSLAEQIGYWKRFDETTRAALQAALERPSHLIPVSQQNPAVIDALSQALQAVIDNNEPADRALQTAQMSLVEQIVEASPPQPTSSAGVIVASPVPNPVAAGATPITFSAWGLDVGKLRRFAQAFNQQNQTISVQIKDAADGADPTQFESMAAASDCFATSVDPRSATVDTTLDLQPLIDADAAFNLNDYPPALLGPFQREMHLYGLPYTVAFRTLVYNRTAFDAANLAYPTADWRLEDLLRAAQQLTQSKGEEPRYGFADPNPSATLPFIFDRFGTATTQTSANVLHSNFTDPKAIQAAQYYLDLMDTAALSEQSLNRSDAAVATEIERLIDLGRVGMWFSSRLSDAIERPGFTAAVAPPPDGTSIIASDIAPVGLYIAAKTQHPDACWTWLKAFSEDLTSIQDGFPARRSLAESDAFLKQAPPGAADVYKAYRKALNATFTDSSGSPATQFNDYWLLHAIFQAATGKNLERELAQAQDFTEQYLACVRAGKPGDDCATAVDPQYQDWQKTEH